MSGRVVERATCDMHDPRDLQTVVDLAEALNANEPAVVVSFGGGRVIALGGPDLPRELLERIGGLVFSFLRPSPEATRQ